LTDTLQVLGNVRGLAERIVVGTTPLDKTIAERAGALYYEYPNSPLSNKWQYGIGMAGKLDPEAVLICGSDDWLTPGWVEYFYPHIKSGMDMVGKSQWLTCSTKDKIELIKCGYKDSADPLGSGRLISARILDKINWNLYPINLESGLDYQSKLVCSEFNAKIKTDNNCKEEVVCVKGGWWCKNTLKMYKNNDNILKEDISEQGIATMNKLFPGRIGKYIEAYNKTAGVGL
jgi:hypothetical protein